MATFMNSLVKEKAKKDAEEQFSRLAADIQSKKLARIGLENQGDIDVQKLSNEGAYAVQQLTNKGKVDVTNLEEAGATGRTNLVQAGESFRQGRQLAEDARTFDLEYGLSKRKDAREQGTYDFEQGEQQYLAPFAREANVAKYGSERRAAEVNRRTSESELDTMDLAAEASRKRKLKETERAETLRRQEVDARNALLESYGLEDLRRQKRRQSAEYLGTVFGGY